MRWLDPPVGRYLRIFESEGTPAVIRSTEGQTVGSTLAPVRGLTK